MRTEQRIKRHGHHLTNLASVGMFCVLLYSLWLACMPWLPEARLETGLLERHFRLHAESPASLTAEVKTLLSLSGVLQGLAWLLPLWMLRRLGRAFHGEALSLATSTALRHLAHTILAGSILMPGLAGLMASIAVQTAAVAGAGPLVLTSSTLSSETTLLGGLREIFMIVVSCICLYSLSHTIRLGAEAADDVRSIV